MSQDGAGHKFVDVQNVRLTYVPAKDRSPDANWAGADVIRMQSYRDETRTGSPLMGPELPVRGLKDLAAFIEGLQEVYRLGTE